MGNPSIKEKNMRRRKKIACFSIAGVLICASVAYGYNKKVKTSPLKIKQAQAKQAPKTDTELQTTLEAASTGQNPALEVANADNTQPVQADVQPINQAVQYPLHQNISTTYFWVGEPPDDDNKDISNVPSAWDDNWTKSFGGVDNPKKRNGLVVANFTPKENSFYFALPYNDFDDNGKRKKDAAKIIPWAASKKWGSQESMLKNQWIKVTKGDKVAYAQWEDVGPFGEDDSAYVFGGAAPQQKTNDDAGLDVSPAVRDVLGLSDVDKTNWQFVDAKDVPDGPWKTTITTSQISWN